MYSRTYNLRLSAQSRKFGKISRNVLFGIIPERARKYDFSTDRELSNFSYKKFPTNESFSKERFSID